MPLISAAHQLNCYESHGGPSLEGQSDDDFEIVADVMTCAVRCHSTFTCSGIVVTAAWPIRCYLRQSLHLEHCKASSYYMSYFVYGPPLPPSWPPTRCSNRCIENTVPGNVLPRLSASNVGALKVWHDYVARIYHERISGNRSVDTSSFSWFYHDFGQANIISSGPCTAVCHVSNVGGPIYDGTPWIGTKGPETQVRFYGFFVHRSYISEEAAVACERLEVFHVASRWLTGDERGASWFYHTVGSGIFLDCHALRQRGRILAFRDKEDRGSPRNDGYESDADVADWMQIHGVAMIIYTQAKIGKKGSSANPRTEVVVRHRQPGFTEYGASTGACLDHPSIDVPLRTGLEGSLPCVCIPQHNFANGDDSDEHPDALNCLGSADPGSARQQATSYATSLAIPTCCAGAITMATASAAATTTQVH